MCPPPGVPPAPENVFPRRGEQCPVEEFSYKGYSLSKCTCNDKHTHIQVFFFGYWTSLSQHNPCRACRARCVRRSARGRACWVLAVCVVAHAGLRALGSVVVTELPVVASFVATENSLSQQRFSPPWPNCVATSNPVTTSEPPAVCGPCRDIEPEGYVKT